MGTLCVLSKTLCPTLKRLQMAIFGFQRERLEPSVLPWRQHSRRHPVSPAMHTSGAKPEKYRSNISGDIFDPAFNRSSGTTYDVITFLICTTQNREYLQNQKRHSKKLGKRHCSSPWKASQISSNHPSLHRHFNTNKILKRTKTGNTAHGTILFDKRNWRPTVPWHWIRIIC